MKASRLINIAGKSILKNKMRTLLTMLGIIIGVGAVIVMVAVGQGAKSEIQQRIDNLGTNMVVVTPAALNQGGVSQGAGTSNRLTIEDDKVLAQQALLLQHVSPVVITFAPIVGGTGNWRTGDPGGDPRLRGHPRVEGDVGPVLRSVRRELQCPCDRDRQDGGRQPLARPGSGGAAGPAQSRAGRRSSGCWRPRDRRPRGTTRTT